jgi:hypothetical protein
MEFDASSRPEIKTKYGVAHTLYMDMMRMIEEDADPRCATITSEELEGFRRVYFQVILDIVANGYELEDVLNHNLKMLKMYNDADWENGPADLASDEADDRAIYAATRQAVNHILIPYEDNKSQLREIDHIDFISVKPRKSKDDLPFTFEEPEKGRRRVNSPYKDQTEGQQKEAKGD